MAHESYERDEDLGGSDKSFCLVFCGVCALIGGFKLWHGISWAYAWFVLSAFFLTSALWFPHIMHRANRAWTKLGLLMFHVVSPIVLGLLFYGCVAPTGLIMRALGKDLLRKRWDKNAASYWIERTPPGPAPESIKQQF